MTFEVAAAAIPLPITVLDVGTDGEDVVAVRTGARGEEGEIAVTGSGGDRASSNGGATREGKRDIGRLDTGRIHRFGEGDFEYGERRVHRASRGDRKHLERSAVDDEGAGVSILYRFTGGAIIVLVHRRAASVGDAWADGDRVSPAFGLRGETDPVGRPIDKGDAAHGDRTERAREDNIGRSEARGKDCFAEGNIDSALGRTYGAIERLA